MPEKFTLEKHEEKMRELLNRKVGQRPDVIQSLVDKAKRKPSEVQPGV